MSLKRETIDRLRKEIRSVEVAPQRCAAAAVVSTGLDALDRLLPDQGYPRGALVEWLSATPGCGAELLSWWTAVRAAQKGDVIVVVAPQREFYPPAAAACGADLAQCVVVQPATDTDAYWAIDQALRCPAVAAVWSAASLRPRDHRQAGFLERMDERWLRRFQLAAEAGGTLGLFVRPVSEARRPHWCDVRWLISPRRGQQMERETIQAHAEDPSAWRAIDLQLLKCRGGVSGVQFSLALNVFTGQMRKRERPMSSQVEQASSAHQKAGRMSIKQEYGAGPKQFRVKSP
ncbi:MAG TPA: hypothetical protein PKD54_02550 [Pirellulaceae bacterium]|nr:hypothetical protein [Pirellulaceae bacterium]